MEKNKVYFIDGRGKNKLDEKLKNRKVVFDWLQLNEGRTYSDCSLETGLSVRTIATHYKAIKEQE